MPTQRIPLIGAPIVGTPNTSGGSVGDVQQRFVNLLPEVVQNPVVEGAKLFLQRREGFNAYIKPNAFGGAGNIAGRGICYWNDRIVVAAGDRIVSFDPNTSTWTPLSDPCQWAFPLISVSGSGLAASGRVGFAAFTGASDYLFVCDGTNAWVISTVWGVTAIADVLAVMPGGHIPYPIYMDGYIFLQALTGEIYNCDAGDPRNWSASSFLTPEAFADGAVVLARQDNQIVAIGEESVQYFYNAGNPTPGSPLSPNDAAVQQYGCPAPLSLATEEGLLVFIARSSAGGRCVVAIDGTNDKIISTDSINKALEADNLGYSSLAVGYLCRMRGKLLYVLTLGSAAKTYAYDFSTQYWVEFDMAPIGSTSYSAFRFVDSIDIPSGQTFVIDSQTSWVMEQTTAYASDGIISTLDNLNGGSYTKSNYGIRTLVETYPIDLGKPNVKFLSKLEIAGHVKLLSLTGESFTVEQSDDEGTTWSTARSILPNSYDGRMRLYRCGSFRRRKWRLTHTPTTATNAAGVTPTDFKLEGIDFDIELGGH